MLLLTSATPTNVRGSISWEICLLFVWLVSLKGSISRAFLVQTERVVHMGRGTRAR